MRIRALFLVRRSRMIPSPLLGLRVFDSFCYMEESMGVAKKIRNELGAPLPSASFP